MNKGIILCLVLLCIFSINTEAEELHRDSPFGVLEFLHWNHSWNSHKYSSREDLERVIGLIQEAGVGFVRMDFLWEDIEPEQGKFQFEKYDNIVDLLSRYNIGILGILDYSAPWASPQRKWNHPPPEYKFFLNYAQKVIERYKDKIKYWEVWNEPDSDIYWEPQDGLKVYSALLKEVYSLAKKIDPECKILNGGLANGISSLNHLYDNGAGDYFDILNIHIFESPFDPDASKRARAYVRAAHQLLLRKNQAEKKIWVTEIGCPGTRKEDLTKNWWLGVNPNEEKQAEWLKEVFNTLLKEGPVEKIFWAFFRDCNRHWDNGIDYFGLVRWDYSKKPAFFAYQECVNNWRKKQE